MSLQIKKFIKSINSTKFFIASLLIFGATGLAASVAISIEKTELIKNPESKLVCDLNPVYSCGKIIDSAPSQTLGLPNEILGMIMFSVLITVGVIMLTGAVMKKWFWQLFLVGMLGFMISVIRLFYISVYDIGALCVLCSAVWFSGWTITTAGYAWVYDQGILKTKKRYGSALKFIRRNIVGFWLLLIMIFIFVALNHFWYYYGQYFGS